MTRNRINMRYSLLIAFKLRSGYMSSFEKAKFRKTRKVSSIELSRLCHYFKTKCKKLNTKRLRGN